jgi:hypothetical protein
VLLTLHRLAEEHGDPAYPAERGTLDAYHRTRTGPAMARLEADGLVRSARHDPEPTPHWELTEKGRARAAALSARLERGGMIAAALDSIPFVTIATGALVGIAASLVGTFLVLRGSSMLSDAISHSIVFGIVVVWLFTGLTTGPLQIAGAAAAGLLTVVLTEALTRTRLVRNDAAIGLVFPALFAAGILLINIYGRDVHLDEHTVLLGEIGFVWLDTVDRRRPPGAARAPCGGRDRAS